MGARPEIITDSRRAIFCVRVQTQEPSRIPRPYPTVSLVAVLGEVLHQTLNVTDCSTSLRVRRQVQTIPVGNED